MNLIDEKKEFRSRIEGLHAADSRFCAVDDAETFWREREKPAEIEEYDLPPFSSAGWESKYHLCLMVGSYASTSYGIVIRKA